MIELLGVGVPRAAGGWLLHRVCARIAPGTLTVVVSSERAERVALLDVLTGRRAAEEGRVWVGGMPVRPDTLGRIRAHVGEVDLALPVVEHRSLLWNLLAVEHPVLRALQGLVRVPRDARHRAARRALASLGLGDRVLGRAAELSREGRARLAAARQVFRRRDALVVREADGVLGRADAVTLLGRLRRLARDERLVVVAGLVEPSLAPEVADRVLAITEGLLVFDGPSDLFPPVAAPGALPRPFEGRRLARRGR